MTKTSKHICTISFYNDKRIIQKRNINTNSRIGKLPLISKKGYTFLGYYVNDEMINEDYIITNDIDIYAKFVNNIFTIKYYDEDRLIETKNYRYNDTINLFEPIRIGYDFLGWYFDKNLLNRCSSVYSDNGKAVTLYAKWQKKTLQKERKHIYYGRYPQRLVTDEDTLLILKEKDHIVINEKEYIKINLSPIVNKDFYFEIKPIAWCVLDEFNGVFKLMSKDILDYIVLENEILNSSISKLNSGFIKQCFSDNEIKGIIKTTTIFNTKENINIPHIEDITSELYGYNYPHDRLSNSSDLIRIIKGNTSNDFCEYAIIENDNISSYITNTGDIDLLSNLHKGSILGLRMMIKVNVVLAHLTKEELKYGRKEKKE